MQELTTGNTQIFVLPDEDTAGLKAVALARKKLLAAFDRGVKPVLWMMAAPSGFSFYRALVNTASTDEKLRTVLSHSAIYQFDDYPIDRESRRFPVTFRHLLEEYLIHPLQAEIGISPEWNPLELKGDKETNNTVLRQYEQRLLERLQDDQSYVLEIKGIGMDGHWGFHGSETALDTAPGLMRVPMNSENIYQQMIDWPQYFKTNSDVPQYAVTCNVAMFMLADTIIDIVPQNTKQFAVLAAYGTGTVSNDIPSSALIRHPDSASFLTQDAGKALQTYRNGKAKDANYRIDAETLNELESIWKENQSGDDAEQSIEKMRQILTDLSII